MVRFISKLIPYEMIPEGIRICLENGIRLSNDSLILIENERYPAGIVFLSNAIEELAKVKLLYKHYRSRNNIPKEIVKKYFGNHEIRFKEIARIIYQDSPSISSDQLEQVIQKASERYQDAKEQFMYVDWQFYRWVSPLDVDLAPSIELDEITIKQHYRQYTNNLVKMVLTVIREIQSDTKLLKILVIPSFDIPKHKIILEIIKKNLSDKQYEYEIRIAINERSILILMNKLNPKIDSQIKIKIQQLIKNRYSTHSVKIKVNEQNFNELVFSSYVIKMFVYVNINGAIIEMYGT